MCLYILFVKSPQPLKENYKFDFILIGKKYLNEIMLGSNAFSFLNFIKHYRVLKVTL